MVLPHLIRYVLLVATRQSTVKVSLSTLAAVFLLSVGLLSVKAGDPVPPAEIQCVESGNCESGQYEEQEPDKEQKVLRSRVQGQGGMDAVNGDNSVSALAKQFQVRSTRIAEWKQQQFERVADVFGGAVP